MSNPTSAGTTLADELEPSSELLFERTASNPAAITIAIPTFRRRDLLRQAIASVAAQTLRDHVELLVVDNDPDSDPSDLVDQFRSIAIPSVRYFRNARNLGMFGNWNQCIRLCRTPRLTILNDDDLLLPTYIEEMQALVSSSQARTFACRSRVRDERPADRQGVRRWHIMDRLRVLRSRPALQSLVPIDYFIRNRHYGSLGILFLREDALSRGGFKEHLFPSADYEFFSGLSIQSPVAFFDKPLTAYRISINESLKMSTVEGWQKIDAHIRRSLAAHFTASQPLVERYISVSSEVERMARMRDSKLLGQLGNSSPSRLMLWRRKLHRAFYAGAIRLSALRGEAH